MFIHSVERTIILQKLYSRFRADALYPGDIVRSIADERKIVEHLCRRNPPMLLNLFDAAVRQGFTLIGFKHRNKISYQLRQVFISGDDDTAAAFSCSAARKGCDNIISLKTVFTEAGDTECCQYFFDVRNLSVQIFRCLVAGCFVFGVPFVPKRRRAGIKGCKKILRPVCF